MDAAALFILPESPRWLVVNNRLDEALSVIRKVYMSVGLANGTEPPSITLQSAICCISKSSVPQINTACVTHTAVHGSPCQGIWTFTGWRHLCE